MNTNSEQVVQEVQEALSLERTAIEKRAKDRLADATQERDRLSRIGSILRVIGASVLAAAMITFLLGRWDGMSQVARYFTFLGFTGVMCGCGLLCGLRIGESKGARTLLGAAALLIPIHFAQIGAMLYSRVAAHVSASDYPSIFFFSVPSLSAALLVGAVGLMALLPMAYMAYAVLARSHVGKLLTVTIAVSSTLLVPTREPLLVLAMASAAGLVALLSEASLKLTPDLRTREAAVARMVPFIALALILGRQSLYRAHDLFIGVSIALVASFLFSIVRRVTSSATLVGFSELGALGCSALSGLIIANALGLAFSPYGERFVTLGLGLSMMGAFTAMSLRATETASCFRLAAALSLLLTGVAELTVAGGMNSCITALVLGILGVVYSCVREARFQLYASVMLTALALLKVCSVAITTVTVSPWLMLGVIGTATIVGASWIERNFPLMRETFSTAHARVAAWK
jgi:hypothetical protein